MMDVKNQEQSMQILKDGDRPWRDRKIQNQLLSAAYDEFNQAKAVRLRTCGSRLTFALSKDGGKRLRGANFCRVRLCPMCTWRRSLKTFSQVNKIMNFIKKDGYSYILLTLTIKNCEGNDLKSSIDTLSKAWNLFLLSPRIKSMIKGYFKSLEITHNINIVSSSYDTYHPHLHILVAVKKSYFNSRYYISQAEMATIWQNALKTDYIPQVDMRKVKGDTAGAVAEVAKYAVKPGDFIIPDDWDLTVETVKILDVALANRRFISFGGVMKEAHKKLELDDADDGDLIDVDGDGAATEQETLVTYVWNSGYNQFYYEND